jgi:hypothetical protein
MKYLPKTAALFLAIIWPAIDIEERQPQSRPGLNWRFWSLAEIGRHNNVGRRRTTDRRNKTAGDFLPRRGLMHQRGRAPTWPLLIITLVSALVLCKGTALPQGAQPAVTLNTPAAGAVVLSGRAFNVDPNKIKVVIYALTNQFYVQPFVAQPFTNIAADGSWPSQTHAWSSLVVLLVDPSHYTPLLRRSPTQRSIRAF